MHGDGGRTKKTRRFSHCKYAVCSVIQLFAVWITLFSLANYCDPCASKHECRRGVREVINSGARNSLQIYQRVRWIIQFLTHDAHKSHPNTPPNDTNSISTNIDLCVLFDFSFLTPRASVSHMNLIKLCVCVVYTYANCRIWHESISGRMGIDLS